MPKPFKISPARKAAIIRLGDAQLSYQGNAGRDHALSFGYEDNGVHIVAPFCSSDSRYKLDKPDNIEAFNKSGFVAMPIELLERLAAHIEDALSISEDMSSEQISRVNAHIENTVSLTRELNGDGPVA